MTNPKARQNRCIPNFLFVPLVLILAAALGAATEEDRSPAPAHDPGPDLVDYSKIPELRWTGPGQPGTYEEYMAHRRTVPFEAHRVAVPGGRGGQGARAADKVLVLVNSSLQPSIQSKLDTYVIDVERQGYNLELYTCTSGTAEALKSFIQSHTTNLIGCVFVGDLPAAWYDDNGDSFPCDLFFMDLDGLWVDNNSDGKYDEHSNGTGDEAPEIFVGRIDASRITYASELSLMNDYFDKLHNYYSGNITQTHYGLTYTEDDWSMFWDICNDIRFAYSNYEVIKAPDTDRDDYRDNRLPDATYEFIQLACHSYSGGHAFTRKGWLYSNGVYHIPPQALFYNLFACSASLFTDNNCLGAVYVFNSSLTALTTIGSTKSGSMLVFDEFYRPLGQGEPYGVAFKEWFEALAPYSAYEISWHYGMSVLGDPMVNPCGFEPHPIVADAKINGLDGPLTFFTGQPVHFTVSLDPGDQAGVAHDWWVFARFNPPSNKPWYWKFPGTWKASWTPIRAYAGGLLHVSDYLVGSSNSLATGYWEFTFGVDDLNNLYEETHHDVVELTIH